MAMINTAGRGQEFVRSLGAFEEIYWRFSQSGPRGFAYAMEVDGRTSINSWREALDALQQSQPLFSVSIDAIAGGIPFFRRVDNAPIPLRVVDELADGSWQAEMARELYTPFLGDETPLLRAVLVHQPNRSVFIICAHHSISDGMSMSAAMCDLFRALTGNALDRHPLLLAVEEQLGIPRAPLRTPLPEMLPAGPPVAFRGPDPAPPEISSLALSADLTRTIAERARIERTTVHGALCSAVFQAGRSLSAEWQAKPVRIFSNIDCRKEAGVGKASAMYFGAGVLSVEAAASNDFWATARRFTSALASQKSREALQGAAMAMTDAVVRGMDVQATLDFLANGLSFEAIISNIGRINFDGGTKDLTLKSIWGSAFLTGVVDEQIIGIGTLNGHLHMLYTSYTPMQGFLAKVETLLRVACGD
jgi:NRPS condensation-like uncharacterized protein